MGAALGFYDGFFGPGTGSFLIFSFIGLCGFSFLSASASAKIVNVATNLSAVLYLPHRSTFSTKLPCLWPSATSPERSLILRWRSEGEACSFASCSCSSSRQF